MHSAVSPSIIVIVSIIGIDWIFDIQILWFKLISWGNGSYSFKTKDFTSFVFFVVFVSKSSTNDDKVFLSTSQVAINLLLPPPKCK